MQRLAALQTSNPYQLSIVKSIPGTFKTEKDFHRIFSKYRIRGEWFRNEGVLKTFINEVDFKLLEKAKEIYESL